MLLSPVAVAAGAVIYVDIDSTGGDGSSWAAAFKYLQDGLAVADANDEIRVAQGTYVPDQNSLNPDGSGDRYAAFGLISRVSVRGGYAGYGEPDPDARDVQVYESILSGDLRGNDLAETAIAEYATARSRAENSYNVVRPNETDETAVLDGFTITGGQADGGFYYSSGGGIYNNSSHPTLVNCTFTRNWARSLGGAVRNKNGSSPIAFKCRFIGNAARSSGGAISNDFQGSMELINCFFTGNVSSSGNGGAVDADNAIELTNCTLSGNSAGTGGGIFIAHGGATLTNCILWGNSDEGGTGQSAQIYVSDAMLDVNFCCIQGWTGDLGGVGNTGGNPLFADVDGADNLLGTVDDDSRLLPGSAALNAGHNRAVPADLISDMDGDPRIIDGIVDMGAYEGATQAILLTTESLTIPEGGTDSFGVSLAMAPEASIEVAVVFGSGDADISVAAGIIIVFDSTNYSTPQVVSVSAAEDVDYLHGKALILAQSRGIRPVGVTVHEQDNEPTTGIVRVDDNSPPGGDGMTWGGAYRSLQDALHMAVRHPQVWEIHAAQGLYRPDEGAGMVRGDRGAAFSLADGVVLKGGYAGLGAPDPDARDVKLYETILSGDLNGDDNGFTNNEENSYHVVHSYGTNETAVLDGFTVTAGNANGYNHTDLGGGMYNLDGSPTVIDCEFTGNTAIGRGGGFYNHEGGPTITGCTFTNNFAGTSGGGMYNHHRGPLLRKCIIADNFATRNGGGIGGDNLYMGDLMMTNCIIVGNEAGDKGGGMYEYDDSELYLTNSIFWDNIAYEGPQMAINGHVDVFIRYCCFQGGQFDIFIERSEVHWGDGNTDADPLFVDAPVGDYHLKSRAGRWKPNDGRWTTDEVTSPCIDAGDPDSDWAAELWPHGKRVNMGAFGGTPQASMSLSSLGNVADIDDNGRVDYTDMRLLAYKWLRQQVLLPEDLNRDAIVNFFDLADFVEEWPWQEI